MQPSPSAVLVRSGLLLAALAAAAPAQQTSRANLSHTGAPTGAFNSYEPAISADGRFVAFSTEDPTLVPGDSGTVEDVFVRDRLLGTTERVSVSSAGVPGASASDFPSLSEDGRYVAFVSISSNLADIDTQNHQDVFIRDRLLGTTKLVSKPSGALGSIFGASRMPQISPDGVEVVFQSEASLSPTDTARVDIYAHNQFSEITEWVSVSTGSPFFLNKDSFHPSMSADRRYVVFASDATNAVPGDTNARRDIFLRDRVALTTTRVSVSSAGTQANNHSDLPFISADGEWIAFESMATNLVADDTNGQKDIFLRHRLSGVTTRVSLSSAGAEGNQVSGTPSLSADGRFVTFQSGATNLVPGDTNAEQDVFLHDRVTGVTSRVSVSSGGGEADGSASVALLTADGTQLVFESNSSNLVPGDTNDRTDIFVHDTTGCPGAGAWLGYGTGLKGSFDHVPALSGSACPLPGATVSLHVRHALGGATGALFFGTSSAAIPFKGGSFRVGGLFFILDLVAGGTPGAPGEGELDLQGTLLNDPILSGFSIFLQTGFADPAAVQQVSLSNGLQMTIG